MISEAPRATTAAFHDFIHKNSIYGLWELASQMTPQPQPKAIPYMWSAALLRQVIEESGEAVPLGEERRAMQLFNPGLDGRWAATNTLITAVQVLLPGEVARAHRHSPTAIRFIMEGSGAYTKVDGERVYMEPGDLILTPSWTWHDHGNDTKNTVVWLDGLDIPLCQALDAMFFQMYEQRQVPDARPANNSQALHGHASLNPTWVKERPDHSPLLLYSWTDALQALEAMRSEQGDAFDGICLEYTNPQTGGSALPTMGCQIQLIRPGERLKAHRHTGSAVYYVAEGQGCSVIDGQSFEWTKGCVLALPAWALHEHANTSISEDAILFSINDAPVLHKTGLFREENLVDGDGHQQVSATFG